MAQLMPLPLTVSCSSKIQIGFTFLVPAHPGSPGQRNVKRMRMCVWILLLLLLQLFNGLFSRTTWVSWHQKDKTSLNLNEARDDGVLGWQWHQLDHMQTICTLLQTDNHTNTSSLNFYRLDAQPTVSKHWRQFIKLLMSTEHITGKQKSKEVHLVINHCATLILATTLYQCPFSTTGSLNCKRIINWLQQHSSSR